MQKIFNNIEQNNYTSPNLIGKHIYFKDSQKDSDLYYIFEIKSIDSTSNIPYIIYKVDRCYMMFVPKNKDCKAFLYDTTTEIKISPSKHELYEMSFAEYVNTFRSFVKNTGKLVKDLPTKLIEDEIY